MRFFLRLMNGSRICCSGRSSWGVLRGLGAVAAVWVVASAAGAQDARAVLPHAVLPESAGTAATAGIDVPALPDAPDAAAGALEPGGTEQRAGPKAGPAPVGAPANGKMAGRFDRYIEQGEQAQRLSSADKVVLGLRSSVTPYAAAAWVIAATYEEIINGSPHYGQCFRCYGQRLGAAAARGSSEGIFSDSVIAPLTHEDPRYYQLGPGHNGAGRFLYSVTRVLVTKTDGGGETVNFALLGGNLAGSALTQAYYPTQDRGFAPVMKTWGTGLLGSSFGFLLNEFFSKQVEALGLKVHLTR